MARLVSSRNLGRELKTRAELAATPVQVELFGGLPVVDEDIIISESVSLSKKAYAASRAKQNLLNLSITQ